MKNKDQVAQTYKERKGAFSLRSLRTLRDLIKNFFKGFCP
jgi:hypothetical protein